MVTRRFVFYKEVFMPVTFNLQRQRNYEWRWPKEAPNPDSQMAPVSPEKQLVLKMRLLSDADIEEIENKQFRARMDTDNKQAQTMSAENLEFTLQAGTIKKLKFKKAVVGWENIETDDGLKLPFTYESLAEVIRGNAGFSMNEQGAPNLSDDLSAHIDEQNAMTRNPQKVRG